MPNYVYIITLSEEHVSSREFHSVYDYQKEAEQKCSTLNASAPNDITYTVHKEYVL